MPRGKSTSKHVKHIKRTKKHVGKRKRLSQIRHRGGMFGNNQPIGTPTPTGTPADTQTFWQKIFGSKPITPTITPTPNQVPTNPNPIYQPKPTQQINNV